MRKTITSGRLSAAAGTRSGGCHHRSARDSYFPQPLGVTLYASPYSETLQNPTEMITTYTNTLQGQLNPYYSHSFAVLEQSRAASQPRRKFYREHGAQSFKSQVPPQHLVTSPQRRNRVLILSPTAPCCFPYCIICTKLHRGKSSLFVTHLGVKDLKK